MEGNETLSRKQEKAILSLLSESSLERAAKACGVSPATLWRWLQLEAFNAAYRQARRDAMGQAIARLQTITGTAVETLLNVMESQTAPASARVSAAVKVLELSIQATELDDLAERLSVLEQRFTEMGESR